MPLPLLTMDDTDGTFRVHEETMGHIVETFGQGGGPLCVVSVAGTFRTGKSFLLNQLVQAKAGDGFGVGSTVQACTKGIWVYPHPLTAADGKKVLFMDTEGIDALDAKTANDVKIFALAVLISSCFVYNSTSHLDESAVNTLSLMTRVAESFDANVCPLFYWVLRDFSLELKDVHGKPMTHAEYLEQALQPPSELGKCATRDAIKQIFPVRHLVTLPRPHKGDSARLTQPNAKFEKFLSTFRSHLLESIPSVRAHDVELTAASWADAVRGIVASVNAEGVLPKLDDTWSLIATNQHASERTRVSALLLADAERDCPCGDASEVEAWLASLVSSASMKFIPPRPDVGEERKALLAQLVHAMQGRVRDVVEEEVEEMLRVGAVDCSQLRKKAETADASYCAKMLLALTSRVLPVVFEECERKGVEKGREEGTLAERMLGEEVTVLKRQLAEEREKKTPLPLCWEEKETQTEEEEAGEEGDRSAKLEAELREAKEAHASVLRCKEDMKASFDSSVEMMKEKSRELVRQLTKERDDAVLRSTQAGKEAEEAAQKVQVLRDEMSGLRTLVHNANDKIVEMHKTTLDEIARRDNESIVEHARAERAEEKAATLKRRLDDVADVEQEAKRLRADYAKSEAQGVVLQRVLHEEKKEKETLRRQNVQLESKIAVLESLASMK